MKMINVNKYTGIKIMFQSTFPALTTVEISTELTTLPSTVQETDTATTLETDSTTLNDESTVIDTTMGVSQPEQLEGTRVLFLRNNCLYLTTLQQRNKIQFQF